MPSFDWKKRTSPSKSEENGSPKSLTRGSFNPLKRISLRNLDNIIDNHKSPSSSHLLSTKKPKEKKKITIEMNNRPIQIQKKISRETSKNGVQVFEVLDLSSRHQSRYALKTISLHHDHIVKSPNGSSKTLDDTRSDFFEIEQRARLEIEALKQIQHSNVLALLDYEWSCDDHFSDENSNTSSKSIQESGTPKSSSSRYNLYCFLLSPLFPTNLKRYIKENGPLRQKVSHVRLIMEGISSGLQAMHDAGFRHNNLTPQNILLILSNNDSVPFPVIADFSSVNAAQIVISSRWEAERQRKFHQNYTESSYRAPELYLVLPRTTLTPKSDAFSLGCVLYHILFGRHAFEKNKIGKLSFPKKHDLPLFLLNLVLGLMLRSPIRRMGVNDALTALHTETFTEDIKRFIWDEFQLFYGVQKPSPSPFSSPINDKNKSSSAVWNKTVRYNAFSTKCKKVSATTSLSSISNHLTIVTEPVFTAYMEHAYDEDDDDDMAEDDPALISKCLIKKGYCQYKWD